MTFEPHKAKAMGNPFADALQWHLDNGVDVPVGDTPVNRMAAPANDGPANDGPVNNGPPANDSPALAAAPAVTPTATPPATMGTPTTTGSFAAQKQKAAEMARAAATLEDLREAIRAYDGLEVKRTATNLVFADGNPGARVMIIGEAPGADEDRQGLPFVGVSGQLLDRMFDCIGLSRKAEDAAHTLYISNILNWRPPGNRTPTEAEIALALPFIERHIALVRPQFLVLAGAVAAKSIMNSDQSISRLRGRLYDYKPITEGINEGLEPFVQAPKIIPTYHPSFLLRTPVQKGKAWADLLMLAEALG